jgi:alpha-galactosidase
MKTSLMKKILAALCCVALMPQNIMADEFIRVNTDNVDLILRVKDNGRLYQSYLGKALAYESDFRHLPQGTEAYLTHGLEDYF